MPDHKYTLIASGLNNDFKSISESGATHTKNVDGLEALYSLLEVVSKLPVPSSQFEISIFIKSGTRNIIVKRLGNKLLLSGRDVPEELNGESDLESIYRFLNQLESEPEKESPKTKQKSGGHPSLFKLGAALLVGSLFFQFYLFNRSNPDPLIEIENEIITDDSLLKTLVNSHSSYYICLDPTAQRTLYLAPNKEFEMFRIIDLERDPNRYDNLESIDFGTYQFSRTANQLWIQLNETDSFAILENGNLDFFGFVFIKKSTPSFLKK